MTKAPSFDHTTKNSPLEGVTITAGAQAPSGSRARRPADEATPVRAATRAPFPLPSNAERSEYEPATQLPQSGLVQCRISFQFRILSNTPSPPVEVRLLLSAQLKQKPGARESPVAHYGTRGDL